MFHVCTWSLKKTSTRRMNCIVLYCIVTVTGHRRFPTVDIALIGVDDVGYWTWRATPERVSAVCFACLTFRPLTGRFTPGAGRFARGRFTYSLDVRRIGSNRPIRVRGPMASAATRAYNGSLGEKPQAGSWSRASGQGVRRASPLKLKAL